MFFKKVFEKYEKVLDKCIGCLVEVEVLLVDSMLYSDDKKVDLMVLLDE